MKLSPHEQKILDILKSHPEILDNSEKRTEIAELYNLSEKTLRNRIAELKKRGIITLNGDSEKSQKILQNGELDLWAIAKVFSNHKWFIAKVTSIFTIVGITYALVATVYFGSFISLYPAGELSQSGGMFGDFTGLAQTFGINSLGNSPTYNIPDIINSRRLKKDVVLQEWETGLNSEKVNLIKYWEIDKPTFLNLREWLLKLLPINSAESDSLEKFTHEAILKLNDLISIKEDITGLITVSVLMEEPQLAADVANYISDFVKKFISYEQHREAKRNLEFVEKQTKKAKINLTQSEQNWIEFKKEVPQSVTAELRMQEQRLNSNIDENKAVYITLLQQLEIAKIDEAKENLLVNILDIAEPAVEKSKPMRTFITLFMMFLGLCASVGYLLLKELRNI